MSEPRLSVPALPVCLPWFPRSPLSFLRAMSVPDWAGVPNEVSDVGALTGDAVTPLLTTVPSAPAVPPSRLRGVQTGLSGLSLFLKRLESCRSDTETGTPSPGICLVVLSLMWPVSESTSAEVRREAG